MKNIIIYIAALMCLCVSCSSESPVHDVIEPVGSLKKVTFSVQGISSESSPFLRGSSSLEEQGIKHLEYWIYKTETIQDGEPVADAVLHAIVNQTDYQKDIILTLENGDYTAIFYALDAEIGVAGGGNPASISVLNAKSQVFSAKATFALNEQNPTVNETVVLNRVIGKIELIIEDLDKLPAEIQSITPFVTGVRGWNGELTMPVSAIEVNLISGYVSLGTWNMFPTILRSEFASINKDNPITIYALPNSLVSKGDIDYTTDLYIQGSLDESFHDLIMSQPLSSQGTPVEFLRKVGAYKVEANKITRYTGNIGNLAGDDFNVIVEDVWDEVSIELQ